MKIVEDEAKYVRELFKRFDKGSSYQQLAGYLNDQPLKPKKGRQWWSQNVKRILSRYEYIGLRLLEDGRLIEVEFPVIIKNRELFDRVQDKIVKKKFSRQFKRAKGLLSGIETPARCGYCGFELAYHSSHAKNNKIYYVCNQRHHTGKNCKLGYVPTLSIEIILDEVISQIFSTSGFLSEFKDTMKKLLKKNKSEISIKTIDNELRRLKREEKNLVDGLRRGTLPEKVIKNSYEDISAEIQRLEEKRKQILIPLEEQQANLDIIEKWITMSKGQRGRNLKEFWNKMDLSTKRFWIKLFFKSIKLTRDKVKFEFVENVTVGGKKTLIYHLVDKKGIQKILNQETVVIVLTEKQSLVLTEKEAGELKKNPKAFGIKITNSLIDGRATHS